MRQEMGGSYPIETLGRIGELARSGEIDHMSCTFSVRGGALRIERITLESRDGPIDFMSQSTPIVQRSTSFQDVMACGS